MEPARREVFVCTSIRSERYPNDCCLSKGPSAIRSAIEGLVALRGLDAEIKINNVDCLEQCHHGGILVVYPDAVWYGFANFEDIEEIVDSHLMGGIPVDRLRLPPEYIKSDHCLHAARHH